MEQKDLVKSFTTVEAFRIAEVDPCQDCAGRIKVEAFATVDKLGSSPFTDVLIILDTQGQPVACLTKLEDQIK